jgi:hypothetical protein
MESSPHFLSQSGLLVFYFIPQNIQLMGLYKQASDTYYSISILDILNQINPEMRVQQTDRIVGENRKWIGDGKEENHRGCVKRVG